MPSAKHQSDRSPRVAMEHASASRTPELSVIVVTPDCYETVRGLIEALRAQSARELLEIILVTPTLDAVRSGLGELDSFCSWRIVEIGAMRSVPQAKRAGTHHATASAIIFTEDHALPDPQWAHALIEAHRGDWAAVAPAIDNGNPESLISWADFVIGYGPWFNPRSGEARELPGHNTSYKREVLLEFDDRLEELLAAETNLHEELLARGRRLYLESAARTYHWNFTRIQPWVPYLYHSARLFAAHRRESWSPIRRIAYAGASPLIPLVRFYRLMPPFHRARPDLSLRVSFPLLFALLVDAYGQGVGYALGTGNADEKLARLEFHRNIPEPGEYRSRYQQTSIGSS